MSSLKSKTTENIEGHCEGWQSFFEGKVRNACQTEVSASQRNAWVSGWDSAHRAAIESHKLEVYRSSIVELMDMGEPLARHVLREKKPPINLKRQSHDYITLVERLRDALTKDCDR